MSEPLHDIDKLFHDSIVGHTEYPPKKVWDKIEAGLDKDTAVTYKRKYKILKRAAVILLFLFLGVLTYEVITRNSGKNKVAGTEQDNNKEQENINAKQDNTIRNDNPDEPWQKNNAENLSQTPDKDIQSPGKDKNADNNKKENLQGDQSQVTSATGLSKDNSSGNSNIGRGEKKDINIEKKSPANKSKKNPGLTNGDEFVINTETPGKVKNHKKDINKNLQVVSPVGDNQQVKVNDRPGTRPSFSLIAVNTTKKNVKDILKPSVDMPSNGSASVLAQLTTAKVQKPANPFLANRGFSVQAFFLPGTAWNDLEDDKPHQPGGSGGPGGPVQDHEEIKKNESRSVAYSTGVKLSYGLNKRISIQTGLNYTKSSTSERPKTIYAEKDNNGRVRYRSDCSSGYTYLLPSGSSNPNTGDRKTVSDIHNTLSYLGIPLEAAYSISSGKISLSASAGGQVNILLKGKTNAVFDKGTTSEKLASSITQGLKPSYFSALAGLVGELRLNDKLSLTAAPAGQFGLSSINQGTSVKTRPNYFGLSIGAKLKL